MASISHSRPLAGVRWTLIALLRRLHPAAAGVAAGSVAASPRAARARHHYPPQRDAIFEQSAMAREMYRL
ncbi:Uncharacterised protein [Mycolicibacterium vanbaalenii]|uniref:Uncharacterized protein n=1 Tax=Mycolicibacterium vanbaalenii TaxID=110539 RepID=A0A5S9Q1T7_MYCVN|nr:hypothetical protein [Mycolicibacterium vanbaalenii]CAA0111464.1 Uncharacterised protein [Mycolicibacterium vanbaalenii]